jgi:hypothetical protein
VAKLKIKSIKVEQVVRFFREGSMLGGTMRAGGLGIETRVAIESDEPEEKIRKMMRMGEQSCFTLGAITNVVPVETHLALNGKPVDYRE